MTAPTDDPQTQSARSDSNRHRRRRLRRLLLVGATLTAIVTIVVANWSLVTGSLEERQIAATRVHHRTLWALGQSLPGTPDLTRLDQRLAEGGFTLAQPILVRIFKREFELEIWKAKDGRYEHFATYPICRWSGHLGPKMKTGDRQAPEGFYSVAKSQLNPNSRWRRSFNLGFPNIYDRVHGRTGSFLMVHGGCGSVGCYAMTNDVIDEIWTLVTAALDAGQPRFQVQAFPFRMTDENLATKADHAQRPFWSTLKIGADLFEQTRLPPRVHVCDGEYVFLPSRNIAESQRPPLSACPANRPARAPSQS